MVFRRTIYRCWTMRPGFVGGAALLLAVFLVMAASAQSTEEAERERQQAAEARDSAEKERRIAEQQRAIAVEQQKQSTERVKELARQLAEQQKELEAQRRTYAEALAKLQEAAGGGESSRNRFDDIKRARLELEEVKKQMAHAEDLRQMMAAKQLKATQFRVFKLRYVTPPDAAMVLKNILGESGPRIAIDKRTNMLLIAGNEDQLPVVEEIVRSIDEPSPGSKEPASAETLQLRVLWLLDGLPEGEGQAPTKKLVSPQVIDALGELGFEDPKVVCQQVSTLTLGPNNREGTFRFEIPVLINSHRWEFSGQGKIEPLSRDRFNLEFQLHFGHLNSPQQPDPLAGGMGGSLGGSIFTPLGHYTVMGTTTIVATDAEDPRVEGEGPTRQHQHLSAFVVYMDRAQGFPGDAAADGAPK